MKKPNYKAKIKELKEQIEVLKLYVPGYDVKLKRLESGNWSVRSKTKMC
jgi:hypothetical protein